MEICDTVCEFTKICLTLLLSKNCGTSVPDDNDTHGMVLIGHQGNHTIFTFLYNCF